jgi:2-haloacid dehalogenase
MRGRCDSNLNEESMTPDDFELLTFDCYGTLIDWESGLLAALRPVLVARGSKLTDDEMLERFGAYESEIEAGPFVSYADVLRGVMDRFAEEHGFPIDDGERESLVASIGDWPAFADTRDALAALKRRFRLGIASNVDDALIARTLPHLGVDFDWIVTAEQVRSYKPGRAHFDEMLARTGLPVGRILHCAQSLYHDVRIAKSLGFTTVWVDRRAGRAGGGATPASDATPDFVVPDLAGLAALMGAA